eukprot:530806-Pyramimonas_sp.AAC.2
MTAPDKRGRSQRSRSGSWFKGGTIRILVTTGTWSRIAGDARMASAVRCHAFVHSTSTPAL